MGRLVYYLKFMSMATKSLEDEKLTLEINDLKNKATRFSRFKRDINGFATLIISLGTLAVLYFSGNFSVKKEMRDLEVARLEDREKELNTKIQKYISDSGRLVRENLVLASSNQNFKSQNKTLNNDLNAVKDKLSSVNSDLQTANYNLNTANAKLKETLRKKRFNDSLYTSLWKSSTAQLVVANRKLDTQWRQTNEEFFKYKQVRQYVEDFLRQDIAKLKKDLDDCQSKLKENK